MRPCRPICGLLPSPTGRAAEATAFDVALAAIDSPLATTVGLLLTLAPLPGHDAI